MTKIPDNLAADAGEPDGAAFLKELDHALEGQNPEGAHAETARFAAQLAGVLQSQRAAAPADLKAKLSGAGPGARKPSTVVRLDRALAKRSRLGVLDWAALIAIVVLGALIWRGLKSEPVNPGSTGNKNLAAEDTKPPAKENEPPPGGEALLDALVEAAPADLATLKKLDRLVSFEFVDTPFDEAIGFIRSLTTANIVVDPKAMAEGAGKTMITLRVQDMPLNIALRWIVRNAELDYELRDGVVFVTKVLHEDDVELRVLDVRNSPIPAKTLAAMLRNLPFGGAPHPAESVEALGNLLRITTSRRIHNQMVQIIALLIEQRDHNTISLEGPEEPWKAELRKKLSKKVTFEFVDTPLEEAVAFIRSLTGATLIIDPAVQAQGTPTINLRVTDMDVELSLQWILRLAELEYQLEDRAVYITSKGNLRPPVLFTGYNIAALQKQHNLPGTDVADMLKTSVDPAAWDEPRSGVEYGEGWLFVMQTAEVHAKIKQALLKLAKPATPRLKAPAGRGEKENKAKDIENADKGENF